MLGVIGMKTVLMVIVLGVVAVGTLLVGYKFYNRQLPVVLNKVTSSPSGSALPTNGSVISESVALKIESPSDGQTVDTATIVVSGTTIADGEVFVNEVDVVADGSGKFSATVNLDDGENVINVIVNDENGNYVEKDLTVIYNDIQ